MSLFGSLFGSGNRFDPNDPLNQQKLQAILAGVGGGSGGDGSPMSDDQYMPPQLRVPGDHAAGPPAPLNYSGAGSLPRSTGKRPGLFGNGASSILANLPTDMSGFQADPGAASGPQGGAPAPQQGGGALSPYSPLPEQIRNAPGDLNQYGGFAPEVHRTFGQKVLRALPVVASAILAPQAAGAIIRHRQGEAQERGFDRMAFNQLVHQGISPAQAHIMLTDPKSLASNFNSQVGAYTLNPGDMRGQPGQPSARNPTRAEQYATALGLQPGTPEFARAVQDAELGAEGPSGVQKQQNGEVLAQSLRELQQMGVDPNSAQGRRYIQDRTLNGQGPTATDTTRRGQDITRYGIDTRSSDSRYGVDTHDATTRRGQETTPAATVLAPDGTPTVIYRNGRKQPIYGGRLPSQARGGRGGSGVSFGNGGGARPRARNAQGQTIEWNGSDWVPVN